MFEYVCSVLHLQSALLTLACAATRRRMKKGRPRSVWASTPILTLPLLVQCDRMLGLRSESLVFTTYYISRRFDINLSRVQSWIFKHRPDLYKPFTELVLAFALLRYDIFHYFYDRGLLASDQRIGINAHELAMLKKAGKTIYTYAYGADVRTRDATLALGDYNICRACPEPGRFCICDAEAASTNLHAIGEHATAMLAMGDMLAYVPGALNVHYWPIDLDRIAYVGVRDDWGQPLKIAHAPNHPHFKGTGYLDAAVARLRSEGIEIDILRMSGRPNEEVLRLLADADLVADQFISGFHGYTALEAMAIGKPVLCYLRGPQMMLDAETCPIINVDPDSLYTTLLRCARREFDLPDIGRRGRAYVERFYSIAAVAERLRTVYLETMELSPRLRRNLECAMLSRRPGQNFAAARS
jgi:hypothetical protein